MINYIDFMTNTILIIDDLRLNYAFRDRESQKRDEDVLIDLINSAHTYETQLKVHLDKKIISRRREELLYILASCHNILQKRLYDFLDFQKETSK